MKNKYYFFKRLYKGYIIVFIKDGKYNSLGYDKTLIKYIKNKDISHVIIDNTFKVKIVDVKINNYYKYLIQEYLKNLLKN